MNCSGSTRLFGGQPIGIGQIVYPTKIENSPSGVRVLQMIFRATKARSCDVGFVQQSKISKRSGWPGGADGVGDGEDVDDFLEDRAGDGREIADGGEEHAQQAGGHAGDGALQGDFAHAAADVEELVDAFERGIHDDGAAGFAGDFVFGTEGQADGGGQQGGGVVDAIAEEEGRRGGGFAADDFDFLLGALLREDFFDADLIGQIADFGFAIAGN